MKRFSFLTIVTPVTCLVAGLAAVFSVGVFTSAHAAEKLVCENRSDIIAGLASTYAEAPVSMGFTEQGTVLEILAGPDGNWTMIETLPSGKACLVASGQMWQGIVPDAKPANTAF